MVCRRFAFDRARVVHKDIRGNTIRVQLSRKVTHGGTIRKIALIRLETAAHSYDRPFNVTSR